MSQKIEEIQERLYREDIVLASTQKRFLSYFIDEIIISFLTIAIFYDAIMASADPVAAMEIINSSIMVVLILKFTYHTFFIWAYGATLGKIAMKIKVISASDFERPDLGKIALRSGVRFFSETLFWLGFIWSLFSPLKQTWHDNLSDSLVVNV